MGRRKIEIKPIKDDRNRAVTFLKRKGGLFKKAFELSELCSVDVTVIIFGQNKKIYEYSASDVQDTFSKYQYYGPAHENKGPADYRGKKDLDNDEEEDVSPAPEDFQPHPNPQHQRQNSSHAIPPRMQSQAAFQHVNHTSSASPPVSNGMQYHPRNGTPQPGGISRPSSRNNMQPMPPAVVAQQHPQSTPPPAAQNGYAYMSNSALYNPQVSSNLSQQPRGPTQFAYPPPPVGAQQQPPQPAPHPQVPQTHHPHQAIPLHPPHQPQPQPQPQPHQQQAPPQHQAVSQAAQQDHQRRQSLPPAFPQDERPMARPEQPQPQQQQPSSQLEPPPPQAKQERTQSPPPPKTLPTKSRSIYTPIDDHRSVLAQHFGFGPPAESPKTDPSLKQEGVDTPSTTTIPFVPPPAPAVPASNPPRSLPNPQRTHSLSSVPDAPGVSRTNSLQKGLKPELKLQIPSEKSDAGSASADSSPRDGRNTAVTPVKGGSECHSAVVLPPPSPSASALRSAGASGPPNPFARPPPPATAAQNNAAYNTNNANSDTPISALPSRFVSDALLPSPSAFYSDWSFGRSGPDSNMLPSPLTFPTPVAPTGPGLSKDSDETEKKRKSPENGPNVVDDPKRQKVD